jgi:hypothetical protein
MIKNSYRPRARSFAAMSGGEIPIPKCRGPGPFTKAILYPEFIQSLPTAAGGERRAADGALIIAYTRTNPVSSITPRPKFTRSLSAAADGGPSDLAPCSPIPHSEFRVPHSISTHSVIDPTARQ